MKKAFPVALMLIGLVFLAAGAYTVVRGIDARADVRDELEAQNIVTPEDASIPNAAVVDAATAQSMADIIGVHADEATGGRSYAELGRYLTPDGGDTSDEAEALKDEAGNPVPNPLRNVAFHPSDNPAILFYHKAAPPGGDEQFGREVQADDARAGAGGAQGHVAGTGGDVEDVVSRRDGEAVEQVARRHRVDVLGDRRVVPRRPGRAVGVLEIDECGHAAHASGGALPQRCRSSATIDISSLVPIGPPQLNCSPIRPR